MSHSNVKTKLNLNSAYKKANKFEKNDELKYQSESLEPLL